MPRKNEFGAADDEATHPDSMRAALAEFVSTFVFVFAGEGSVLALDKVYKETGGTELASGLVVVALAHALALFSAVASSINISGGHVNPAVTFGSLVGGRISVFRAVFYWPGCPALGLYCRSSLVEACHQWHALDPKRGSLGIIAPLAIGLMVGANILVGGPFDGACMNPARAFGPALIGWRWRNHWIYWVGPFLGVGLAAPIYEYIVIPTEPAPHHAHQHQPLPPED
ncbi:hypothetical protein DKX38_027538 [Salix brachista]|uniref:Tonoplast intrinsic protein n=1 Tax=Salix brachista TaxID=2182728 RepID=A0A5N5JGB0_9ROSI|nr:hypothetical protein DKX38_027538 [Salix brachista]